MQNSMNDNFLQVTNATTGEKNLIGVSYITQIYGMPAGSIIVFDGGAVECKESINEIAGLLEKLDRGSNA